MKTAIVTVVLAVMCVAPAYAANPDTGGNGQARDIEQRKAEVIQHIKERIANSQAEIACVNAAQSHHELWACHEQYRPRAHNEHRERKPE